MNSYRDDKEDVFVVVLGETTGCYNCDPTLDHPALVELRRVRGVSGVVNLLHDIMDGKEPRDWPLTVNRIGDYGAIEPLGDVEIEAGCLSGLKVLSFKVDGLRYRVRKGQRK